MSDLLVQRHPVNVDFIGGEIKSTGLSFDDYSRMATQLHKLNASRRLAAPSWAYNDDQTCAVIVRSLEERALLFRRVQAGTNKERLDRAQRRLEQMRPELTARIDRLCARFVTAKSEGVDAPAVGIQVEALDTQLRILPDVPKILAGIVYFYWRCGFNSVETGQQLGVKPPHVRQMLKRLLDCAKLDGFAPPDVVVRYKRTTRHAATYPRRSEEEARITAGPLAEVIKLYKEGKYTIDIARELELGVNGCEVVNLILIQAGLR